MVKVKRHKTIFLILFVALSIVVVLYFVSVKFLYEVAHGEEPCFAPPEAHSNVLYVVSWFDRTMGELNLTRWIDHGTLLGSLLFADFIPWDHDGDMAYLFKDSHMVNTVVRNRLTQRGIEVRNKDKLVQLVYKGTKVDVFAYGTYKDLDRPLLDGVSNSTLTRIFLRNSDFFERHYQDFNPELLFPLSRCWFGSAPVSCPRNSRRLLKVRYPYSYWLPFLIPYKLRCYLQPWNLLPIVFSPKKLLFSFGFLSGVA